MPLRCDLGQNTTSGEGDIERNVLSSERALGDWRRVAAPLSVSQKAAARAATS